MTGLPLFSQAFSEPVESFIAVADPVVAITDVKLFDGTGALPRPGQTILLSEGRIVAVGDSGQVALPENVVVIDGTGKTVIPGLVMLHEHLFYTHLFENWFDITQMSFTFPRLYLAGGATTIRTAGSIQPQSDLNVKQYINAGKMTGPKMDVTGPFIEREGVDIVSLNKIADSEEVARIVNYWADKGATSFKVYNNITREDMKICIEEAHKRGLKVTGHLCSVTYEEASELGIDCLEHGFMVASDFFTEKVPDLCDPFGARQGLLSEPADGERIDRLIDILIRNGTAVTTTPNVFEPFSGREIVPGGGMEALSPQLQERTINIYNSRIGRDSVAAHLFRKNMTWLRSFYDKGGLLVAGTDPTGAGRTVAGYANRRTVELLVESGFSIPEAIKICTLNGALYLEQEDRIGSVEAGKQADLVLIAGDLEADIRNIRKMEIVFKDGVGFDSRKLFESVKGKVGAH